MRNDLLRLNHDIVISKTKKSQYSRVNTNRYSTHYPIYHERVGNNRRINPFRCRSKQAIRNPSENNDHNY